MEAIISKTDVQDYKEIANVISDIATLEPYIMEAQNIELRELLGDALFYALIENLDDEGMYDELVKGKEYTYLGNDIYYDGIKPLLCYITFARMLEQHGVSVTRFGLVNKSSAESTPADDGSITRLIAKTRSTAKFYEKQVVQFLDTYRTIYTLWGVTASVTMRSSIQITQITND